MLVSEIRSRDVGSLLNAVKEEYGYSEQSMLHVYNALHKAFHDAMERYEYVSTNPVKSIYRPVGRRKLRNFLLPMEAVKLLNRCQGEWIEPAIQLGLLAGLRPSEIQALRWASVDFGSGFILIREAFKRKSWTLEQHPKQGDWGKAAIPKPLREFLKRLTRKSELVAPSPIGKMLNYNALNRELTRLCGEAGVKRITSRNEAHHTFTVVAEWGVRRTNLDPAQPFLISHDKKVHSWRVDTDEGGSGQVRITLAHRLSFRRLYHRALVQWTG